MNIEIVYCAADRLALQMRLGTIEEVCHQVMTPFLREAPSVFLMNAIKVFHDIKHFLLHSVSNRCFTLMRLHLLPKNGFPRNQAIPTFPDSMQRSKSDFNPRSLPSNQALTGVGKRPHNNNPPLTLHKRRITCVCNQTNHNLVTTCSTPASASGSRIFIRL